MMAIEKEIGKRIRQARRMRMPEMSIEKLAEIAGLSRQTVSAVENGKQKKVSFDVVARLAHALGLSIDLDELMGTEAAAAVADTSVDYGKKNIGKGTGKGHGGMVPRRGMNRTG